jgi:hypothetical protein
VKYQTPQQKSEIEKIEYLLNNANPPLRDIQRSYLQGYLKILKKESKREVK